MKSVFWVLLALLFFAPIVFAQTKQVPSEKYTGKRDNISQSKWWEFPKVSEALKLTKDENKKLDNLYVESRKKSIDLRAAVQKEQLVLNEIMNDEKFTAKTAVGRYEKLQKAQNKLALMNFEYQARVRELLGYERYKKVQSMVRQARLAQQKARREADRKKRENRRQTTQPSQ